MDSSDIRRVVEADGTVVLRGGPGTFRYRTPRRGVLCISVEGDDNGQFGTRLVDEIAAVLDRAAPLEIFVDASAGSMPGLAVNGRWARFFTARQRDIAGVHILVGSRTAHLGLAIAQRLSPAGKLIRIHTDRQAFEARRQGAG